MRGRKKIIEINSLEEIPMFKSENEEREFWETHYFSDDLAQELHDPKAEKEFRKIQKRLKMTDRRR